MRSFRDSIARPTGSLCTLRAGVTADYATLASEWWLTFLVPSFQTAGLIQSISLLLCTSFDYGLFTAREDSTPQYLPRRDFNPQDLDLLPHTDASLHCALLDGG